MGSRRLRSVSSLFCLFLWGTVLMFSSCIKKALPNIEADILSIVHKEDDFFADPVVTNDEVKLFVDDQKINVKAYAFAFKLSRGASSVPVSGSIQDFTDPVIYTVTSENGEFSKKYTVTLTNERVTFMPLEYDFEDYSIHDRNKYTEFFSLRDERKLDTWDSGNAGFVFSISPIVKKQAELYPMQYSTVAHGGKVAVKLETKSTGSFGAGAKKPIAAGNIFMGEFDSGNVMGDPLQSTHFGRPIEAAPVSFAGFYHYTPGKQVIDHNSKPMPNVKDTCSIVAVLFDADELKARTKVDYLDGTNLLTDKSIVATALLYDELATVSKDFKSFKVDFDYRKVPQLDGFAGGKYRLAIVMSASKNGDIFQGAIGSVLLVDDIKITVK
ncbi:MULTISPECIES: PCMD domain-containing protein [Sphingobacterium]|uniref:PCMD domain-containing protein n=1 Tax=Sphingobacterium TaxID=28453 RepID=UPI0013DD506F|nr:MULTISPECIES: PCMD domain-containing protein [unclassified Sphingobacterium]